MIHSIWLFLLLGGILAAAVSGNIDVIFPAFIDGAVNAIDVALGLGAFLAIWCGVMRLAEKSGLLDVLAKLFYPFLRWLFPNLAPEHKAWGAIIMNVSANFLGLGNAATPFGIKAMEELAATLPQKGVASRDMIVFLALNTSAVSLVPGMIMGLRADAGSLNAAEIIIPSFLASLCGLCAALAVAYLFDKVGKKS
ncbi:MAG: nucleoside recognition domain-containing protein [Clostridiales bacterium]